MALTKSSVIEKIVTEMGYPKTKSTQTVETLLEVMKSTLESGEDVLVSGFGKFCVREKEQRRGRNPATGDDLTLSSRRVVTFKCSGKLRDQMNGKKIATK